MLPFLLATNKPNILATFYDPALSGLFILQLAGAKADGRIL
jgi:hypothetical protein